MGGTYGWRRRDLKERKMSAVAFAPPTPHPHRRGVHFCSTELAHPAGSDHSAWSSPPMWNSSWGLTQEMSKLEINLNHLFDFQGLFSFLTHLKFSLKNINIYIYFLWTRVWASSCWGCEASMFLFHFIILFFVFSSVLCTRLRGLLVLSACRKGPILTEDYTYWGVEVHWPLQYFTTFWRRGPRHHQSE